MRIYLIIPAYNEGKNLISVLAQVGRYVSLDKVIVVDDGSKKPVSDFLKPACTVLRHQINLGKGAAMKTGADYAFKNGAGAVIFMDADGQHDPQELFKFKKYLKKGYDLVLGSRRPTIDAPLLRLLGNKFASIYVNVLFGIYVSDILSGYRALTLEAYQELCWTSIGYGVETEMVARLGKVKDKLKWIEFPIETVYLDKYKGVTIVDGLKIFVQILWWKLF